MHTIHTKNAKNAHTKNNYYTHKNAKKITKMHTKNAKNTQKRQTNTKTGFLKYNLGVRERLSEPSSRQRNASLIRTTGNMDKGEKRKHLGSRVWSSFVFMLMKPLQTP
jgi:hypothetical protein